MRVRCRPLDELLPLKKWQDAIDYGVQICEALEEAHAKGIVHRDIKTQNIMVNPKNQAKVMDFGLAKLRGSFKLTRTASTVGTLAYMAPEHLQGAEVDARSDIFSFGVVLYEMLTGHLPFRDEHEAAVMYSILNEEPESLQHYLPDAPSELLHVISRALEKDPDERYQNVREVLIDLRRIRKQTARVLRPAVAMAPPGYGGSAEEHPSSTATDGPKRKQEYLDGPGNGRRRSRSNHQRERPRCYCPAVRRCQAITVHGTTEYGPTVDGQDRWQRCATVNIR